VNPAGIGRPVAGAHRELNSGQRDNPHMSSLLGSIDQSIEQLTRLARALKAAI
jgi:hypothetical protein